MTTIKDVAKEAGVSTTTVSKVLNNHPVKPPTRKRVQKAITELRYVPRGTQANTSQCIGLLVPSITLSYFGSFTRSVAETANRDGYMVSVCSSDRDPDQEKRHLEFFCQKNVAGIIVYAPITKQDDFKNVDYRGIPVIAVENGFAGTDTHVVSIDNAKGITESVEHLLNLGHSRIALIIGPLSRPSNRERLKSFTATMQSHGIEPEKHFICESTFDYEAGYHNTWELLHLDQPPSAIITSTDHMAIGSINAAKESGLSVPQHLSVIGSGDTPEAALWRPQLTTIRQPVREAGVAAVEALVRYLRCSEAVTAKLATRLIVRESTQHAPLLLKTSTAP